METKNIEKNLFVSVVSVLSNDADIVNDFVKETSEVLHSHYQNYEFILVDDGSDDATPIIIDSLLRQYQCLRYLRLSRRFGTEIALSAGLDSAIGDIIVMLEPEMDPPSLIPGTVEKVNETNSVVFNISKNRKSVLPLYYRMGKALYYRVCRMFLKFFPPEDAGLFIGLNRQHLNSLIQIHDHSRFLRIFTSQIGYGMAKQYYNTVFRRQHPKKKNVSEAVEYAFHTIIANSVVPLKMAAFFGLIAAFLNLLYIAYVFINFILKSRTAEGWTTLSLQNAGMFFFLFVIMAIFLEYLSWLIEESKERPLYFIIQEKNSAVMITNRSDRRNVFDKPTI